MEKTFKGSGNDDFKAYYDACEWLNENGYSHGSMCREEPIAIMKGDYNIAKWRNISVEERNTIDGTMMAKDGDWRNATVAIEIYENEE